MDNKHILEFFKNLPYDKIIVVLICIFVCSILFKLFKKFVIDKMTREKARTVFIFMELFVIGITMFIFFKVKQAGYINATLIASTIAIFEVLNLNIIFIYFLEKCTSFLSKLYYFMISIFIALLPSVLFTLVIYEITILLA